jgi:hypothetical protein
MEDPVVNMPQTEIQRIQALLPTELFESSKDWSEGSPADRVEWLLSMYASAREEVKRLERLVDDIEASAREEVKRLERLVDDIEDDLASERQANLNRT